MTLKERETNFLEEVHRFDYDQNILSEFFEYWSEPNKKGKMRFELEKTWDTKRRLQRWYNNQKQWNETAIGNIKGAKPVPGIVGSGGFGQL